MMPLLSVCVVSYNHEKYIKECIESIWNNDYKNIEILALDDGSKDNSANILKELQKNSPYPMTVFVQKNSGNIGANFNKLFKAAKGEYITVLACDDKLAENTLNFKIQKFLADKNLAFICHSKINGIDENSNLIYSVPLLKLDEYEKTVIDDLLKLEYSELNAYYMQGTIYLKSIVDKIGGFDEDMICDDIVFRTKMSLFVKNNPEYKFEVLHSAGVYYRRHSTNVSSNIKRQIKGVIQYLKKYWNNEKPPKTLINWIKSSIKYENDFKEVFFDDNYTKQIFESFVGNNLLIRTAFLAGYLKYKFIRFLQKVFKF